MPFAVRASQKSRVITFETIAMQSIQLACPHCGSTLSFGTEIAPGASVECMICMQSFAASVAPKPRPTPTVQSIDAPDSPTLSDTITDVLPRVSVSAKVAAKAKPAAVGIMEKPTPKPAKSEPKRSEESAPLALRKPKPDASAETTSIVALIGGAAVFLLVLSAGIGLAVWKAKSATKDNGTDDSLVIASTDKKNNAVTKNDVKSTNDAKKTSGPAKTNTPPTGSANKPAIKNIADDGDEKSPLKRKNPKGAGTEAGFDLLNKFDVAKTNPVGLNQQRINEAIDKGVVYLRQTQKPDGTWASGHGVGHAAIGGLTLLECGVPANDFCVQRSAFYVRNNVLKLASTYELSLAILFLDRLGDPRDRPTIQGMGLRLLAGQKGSGGWHYPCPLLEPTEMYQLWAFLQTNRQPNLLNPLQGQINLTTGIVTDPRLANPLPTDPAKLNDPFQALNAMMLTKGIDGAKNANPGAGNPGANPQNPTPPQPKTDPVPKKKGPPAKQPFQPVIQQAWLKPILQNLPVVQNQGKGKGQQQVGREEGDNSNTQFAILALWAARRHGVPTEQGILAAYQRFVTSQNTDGGWGYHMANPSTSSMTCVGLLGNGMGHGTAPDIVRFDPANLKNSIVKPALDDERIQNGLKALAKNIGQPSFDDKNTNFPMQNLYFLWSVERVAMLYDLKTINGKDWYGWGAQILVHNQQPTGLWQAGGYHGESPSLNTCFALLFLKRSNLVQDLTDNLRLYSGIRNPDAP